MKIIESKAGGLLIYPQKKKRYWPILKSKHINMRNSTGNVDLTPDLSGINELFKSRHTRTSTHIVHRTRF